MVYGGGIAAVLGILGVLLGLIVWDASWRLDLGRAKEPLGWFALIAALVALYIAIRAFAAST